MSRAFGALYEVITTQKRRISLRSHTRVGGYPVSLGFLEAISASKQKTLDTRLKHSGMTGVKDKDAGYLPTHKVNCAAREGSLGEE
jgi:hypothetical protein